MKKKNKLMTLSQLSKCEFFRYLFKEGTSEIKEYFVKIGEKRFLIKRIGECDPIKCKSECCRFIHSTGSKTHQKYMCNFGIQTKYGIKIPIKCKQLTKDHKCKLWDEDFPKVCKDFPLPLDEVYHECYKNCGFRFKIIEEYKVI